MSNLFTNCYKLCLSRIDEYPLIASCLSCLFGIVLSSHLRHWYLPVILLGTSLLFFFLSKTKNFTNSHSLLALILLFLSLGTLLGKGIDIPPTTTSHITHQITQKEEVLLVGTYVSFNGFNGEISKIVFETEGIRHRQKVSYKGVFGKVLLSLEGNWPRELLPGDRLAIRAILKHPRRYLTPGSFDYPTYLSRKNLWVIGYIPSPIFIQKVDANSSFFHRIRYLPERIRFKISEKIDNVVEQPARGIYKALIIGDKSDIDKTTLENFKGSGCMHLLAISGLHLSLLGLFLYTSILWLLRRSEYLLLVTHTRKLAATLCILPLFLYTLVAGANPPVIRSCIMAVMVICALIVDRKQSFFTLVALAALLLLVVNPSHLYTPSFQLTFAAVLSIGAISANLSRLLSRKQEFGVKTIDITFLHWLYASIAISIVATLGTAPLLLYYFNRISLVSFATTLLIEPLLCFWSLPIGIVASIMEYISPPLSEVLFKLGSVTLDLANKIVSIVNEGSFASLWLPTPSIYSIIFYFTGLTLVLGSAFNKGVKTIGLLILFVALFLFFKPPQEIFRQFSKISTISFLDVGQGSSTFINFPNGKTILIDGGAFSSSQMDIGRQVIAPFLWQQGISKIDTIIITHPHTDHYNGISFILRHFQPEELIVGALEAEENQYQYSELLLLAKNSNIEVRNPKKNGSLISSGGAELLILPNPLLEMHKRQGLKKKTISINDASLILQFKYAENVILFPADIGKEVESLLVSEQTSIESTILLAAHHGSSSSNSENFLEAVSPKIMVVSRGKQKETSKAAATLAKRCNTKSIELLSTAQSGTVVVKIEPQNTFISTFLDPQERSVTH